MWRGACPSHQDFAALEAVRGPTETTFEESKPGGQVVTLRSMSSDQHSNPKMSRNPKGSVNAELSDEPGMSLPSHSDLHGHTVSQPSSGGGSVAVSGAGIEDVARPQAPAVNKSEMLQRLQVCSLMC